MTRDIKDSHSSPVHLPKSPALRWGAFFVLGLLLIWGLSSWRASSALAPAQAPLPQDAHVKVYFNQNQASVYSEPYRKTTRYGDNLEQIIIDALGQAQSSIDIAVHELNLPEIARVLSQQSRAGVHIRLIVENTYSRPWSNLSANQVGQLDEYQQGKYSEFIALVDKNRDGDLSLKERDQRDAFYILQQAQIPLLDDTADGSKGSGLMHHKFAVIDRHQVLVGSANWTLSDIHGDFSAAESRGNANAQLVIESPELAAVFTEEFEQMWGDGPSGKRDSAFGLKKSYRGVRSLLLPGSTVQVQFSPTPKPQTWAQSVNGLIAKTLQQAQSTVDLALFVFSEQAISNTLFQVVNRGVQVKALIDPGFVYRDYSEGLDMLGVAIPNQQCRYESNNSPWPRPILSVGTPKLPQGDKLHHKFALIDNAIVIIGSQNWSKAANETNDENLLVIRNPTVATHFRREYNRLYNQADLGMTGLLQATLTKRRRDCGL